MFAPPNGGPTEKQRWGAPEETQTSAAEGNADTTAPGRDAPIVGPGTEVENDKSGMTGEHKPQGLFDNSEEGDAPAWGEDEPTEVGEVEREDAPTENAQSELMAEALENFLTTMQGLMQATAHVTQQALNSMNNGKTVAGAAQASPKTSDRKQEVERKQSAKPEDAARAPTEGAGCIKTAECEKRAKQEDASGDKHTTDDWKTAESPWNAMGNPYKDFRAKSGWGDYEPGKIDDGDRVLRGDAPPKELVRVIPTQGTPTTSPASFGWRTRQASASGCRGCTGCRRPATSDTTRCTQWCSTRSVSL